MADFFSGHWAFAFGLLGNIFSFLVFLSPTPTFYQIYKKKTSEGYQCIPYVIGLFSAMLWIYYAVLKTNVTLLITINSVGIFTQTIYIGFYVFYAPRKEMMQTMKLLVSLVLCGFGCIVLSTEFLVKAHLKRVSIVGWICLIFSLSVFVAPLFIVRKVIRTKSVEYMPFLLSFFLTLSAVMWFFYGLLIKDFNVAIPNVLGFSFGMLQMALYMKYRKPKTTNIDQNLPTHDQLPSKLQSWMNKNFHKLTEQFIEIVKLRAMLQAEKVASQQNNNPVQESHIQKVPKEIAVDEDFM